MMTAEELNPDLYSLQYRVSYLKRQLKAYKRKRSKTVNRTNISKDKVNASMEREQTIKALRDEMADDKRIGTDYVKHIVSNDHFIIQYLESSPCRSLTPEEIAQIAHTLTPPSKPIYTPRQAGPVDLSGLFMSESECML
jgi:hypothetical protein